VITLKLTDQEIEFIKNSLRTVVDRCESEERLALQQGRTDAASFYCDSSAKAISLLLVIDTQTAKESEEDDEDVCGECGEDYGFCQCEED
jgi:hypothetical protein